jgi:hypothetical protein
MDESKRRLDSDLRQALEQEAGGAPTDHPELELLTAYHHGELDEVQEASMQEHLLWCRECPALLLGLDDLSRAAAPDPETTRPPEALRDPGTGDRAQASASAGAGWTLGRRLQPILTTLLAASVLLCAGLVFQILRLQRTIDHLSEPQVDVAVQDLYLEDSFRAAVAPSTGEATANGAATLPAEAEWITLILNAPALGISETAFYEDHQLIIENDAGDEIWQRRGLTVSPYGTFSVVLHRDFLDPGSYRLRVLGLQQDRWVEIGSFALSVPEA